MPCGTCSAANANSRYTDCWDTKKAFAKTPYASQLFGDDPQETYQRARRAADDGFEAVKFGWGPYGRGSLADDEQQVQAAREGLGNEKMLLVDAGTVWGDDVGKARLRLNSLKRCRAGWLEEPFVSGALGSYSDLADEAEDVRLAGGEGCNNFHQAKAMVDYAKIGYLQIDAGRVGGITTAKQLADYARAKGVGFVNHTFTTQLALSASLAAFAGIEKDYLCEYPVAASPLAVDLTVAGLLSEDDKRIQLPDAPGLGVEPNPETVCKYLVEAEIRVAGKTIYSTPTLD